MIIILITCVQLKTCGSRTKLSGYIIVLKLGVAFLIKFFFFNEDG